MSGPEIMGKIGHRASHLVEIAFSPPPEVRCCRPLLECEGHSLGLHTQSQRHLAIYFLFCGRGLKSRLRSKQAEMAFSRRPEVLTLSVTVDMSRQQSQRTSATTATSPYLLPVSTQRRKVATRYDALSLYTSYVNAGSVDYVNAGSNNKTYR